MLRASQQILEGIINAIPVRVFWKDKNLVFLGCNAIFARDAGFTDPNDIIGKDDYQMVWRDQAELYRADDNQVIESGRSKLLIEEQQTTPEWNIITLLTSKIPLYNSKGEISGVLGTYMDITDRKRAEEALRQKEEQYRKLSEDMPVYINTFLPDGTLTYVNKELAKMSGMSQDEMVGLSFFNMLSPDNFKIVREELKLLSQEKPTETHEQLHIASDGSKRWQQWANRAFFDDNGRTISFQAVGIDITERKQTEQALREERQRLAGIIKGTNVGTWEWNVQTGETIFNDRWAEIIGYTLDEISPVSIETWMKFAHPDDLKISGEVLEKHFRGETDYYEFETRMKHKDGSWVWVLDRGQVATWTEDEKPLMMMGTHQDITVQKRTEERLLKSEEKFNKAFHSSPILTAISTVEEGRFLDVNEIFLRTILFSKEELIGKTSLELGLFANPAQRQTIRKIVEETGYVKNMEVQMVAKDGHVIDGLFSAEPIALANEKCWLT
ncbi:MAG: PAS domain S-box protein, partial [Syntrophus sp. (in: bacteria)]